MTARTVEYGDFSPEQMRMHRAREALHRDGASPSGTLELLATIVEERTWERLADAKGRSFEGRFRAFVNDGLRYDPDQLLKVSALRHPKESQPDVAARMANMREQVRGLLLDEIEAAGQHGGPRQDGATFLPAGLPNTSDRVVARLKRDDPDLAEKVITGELSPNAAARAKGWRRPRIVVSTPERVAVSLRKHMDPEALTRLADLLKDER